LVQEAIAEQAQRRVTKSGISLSRYAAMRQMFITVPPAFDEIVRVLSDAEQKINSHVRGKIFNHFRLRQRPNLLFRGERESQRISQYQHAPNKRYIEVLK